MLTLRQKQIGDFVTKIIVKKTVAPSEREVARHFHISASTAHEHLQTLKEKGYLQKVARRARGIKITEPGTKLIQIPLRGTIAAGQLHEAIENKETIAVPQSKLPFPSGDYYALRVSGNSMIEENISDGDIVLVKNQNTAQNGEKVVALVDNSEATLKKFYKDKNNIRLEPANKNFEPIIVRKNIPFAIQGVVVDVVKTNGTEYREKTFVLPAKTNTQQRGVLSDYLNRVYNGDVMHVLKDLPDNSVDMIFGDPDYNVGIKYGNNDYTKNFDDYINWYIELLKESMRVLKNDGNLFMMNYPQQNAHLRVKYLDLHFPYTNEYVWVYNTNVGHTPKRFTTAHRSILHVRKSADNKFFKDEVALPYKNPTDKRIQKNLANGSKGRMPYSWFEFNLVKNVSKEKTEHACQIPQKLTELLIKSCTREGDIVFPLFGGSGAEVELAFKLGREFVTAELNPRYCEIIEDRLRKGYIDKEYRLGPRGKRKLRNYFPHTSGVKMIPTNKY